MAALFFTACDKDIDFPGSNVGGDGNSIILDLSSGSLPVSRALNATGVEIKVDHIDVLIFGEDGSKKHHERVNGSETGSGTIALTAKRSDFAADTKYWVHLIANSTADESVFAAEDFDRSTLLGMTQEDDEIHMTGCPSAEGVPQAFLMDGVAYLKGDAEPEPTAAGPVVLNNGNKSDDTKLQVTLRRAAAKLVIRINKGRFVEFNNESGTRAGYYLRNMPYTTSVVAGIGAEASLRTPVLTDNAYFRWTQDAEDGPYTLITVTAYAYAHTWENESALEKETRLIVNIPMYAILHDADDNYIDEYGNPSNEPVRVPHVNSYYQIPVCRGKALERNTCYEVSLTLNVPGGTEPSNPVVLEPIEYEVRDWDEKTINIGNDKDRPTYLTVNEDEIEMRNISEDHTTLQFVSSSEVAVEITSVYYYDKYGAKQELDEQQQEAAHISADPDPGLTGKIDIKSDVPTNNAIRYIELKVTNSDNATPRTVTIAQYPLEYIKFVMGKHAYRSDFGVNGEDGNPTTYERLNGLYTSPHITSSQISERRVSCMYYGGEWLYENRFYYLYFVNKANNNYNPFFASKCAEKNTDGSYNIYYFRWEEMSSASRYTYTVNHNTTSSQATTSDVISVEDKDYYYYGDKTSYTNPRMYHVQITASSGDYTLGKPRIDAEGYTDSGADNAKLVSPSFMLASQLGTTASVSSFTVAQEHCKRYVEVAEDGTVYDDWRLPTRAEVEIIMKFQYKENAVMDEVLSAKYYYCADGKIVENTETSSTKDNTAIRCIRDAYDDKKTGN